MRADLIMAWPQQRPTRERPDSSSAFSFLASLTSMPPYLAFHLDAGIADTVLATQIGNGNAGLLLLQNRDDLLFGEPGSLHLWSF